MPQIGGRAGFGGVKRVAKVVAPWQLGGEGG